MTEIPVSKLTKKQDVVYWLGPDKNVKVTIRWDDDCNNGHNTFSITGYDYRDGSCGCIHDRILELRPDFKRAIDFHLCSSDGPLHYISNTLYLAGDRDCHGLKVGESKQIRNGRTGKLCWIATKSKLHNRIVDSDERPTDTEIISFEPLMRYGEGKERQLDSARSVAIWPEATDEELIALTEMPLEEATKILNARLPTLLNELKSIVESFGMEY